jgi:uncharacterized lipoprotein YddW (UPF0748 family)
MTLQRSQMARLGLAGLAVLGLWLARAPLAGEAAAAAPPQEVRALWILRTSLGTPAAIAAMVRTARDAGFNTLFVQVRGRGDAFYAGGPEPRGAALAAQPASFDPLAVAIGAGHAAGLKVHAWMNVNLVSSATTLPTARSHVVHRHPEWLMVPRALADEMATVEPQSPAYVGKLARWSRASAGRVEGLYASPLHPGYAQHMEGLVSGLVERYAVDGVHLDYLRFPGVEFDYSRAALAEFRAEVLPDLTTAERQRLDARLRVDPMIYADMFPERWARFRRSRVTALMMRLRTAVKNGRPEALVTAAVFPDQEEAFARKLQDWRSWLEAGFVDAVCPMAYSTDRAVFAAQIQAARQIAGGARVWAGIGSWRLSPARTIENILTARRLGAAGIALFSYDSLADPAQHPGDYLAQVRRGAFADRHDALGSGSDR